MSKAKQTEKDASAFFKAANKGDVAKLKTLIDAGQKVDARDDTGKTALMRAAERGHLDAAQVLLVAGADTKASVSDRDSIWFGCNALLFAAQSGNTGLVETLIQAGCNPGCEASEGTTPLSLAVGHRSSRMVEALLKAGAALSEGILVTSVWDNAEEISLQLIGAGADANACNELGQSVLHRTAEKGQLEVLKALLRAKAKLNVKANGSTPLLVAIQNGHVACALELIRAGADLCVTGLSRRDPLMNAAFLGQTEVVRALLDAGADPNARGKDGKTALMLANEKEHSDVVELLRASGGDDSGYKVQEYIRAAVNGDVERVRDLLKAGVDVNATNPNGAKALISAVMKGHAEVVRVLISHGVDVDTVVAADFFGIRIKGDALTVAAEQGHLDIVRLLLQAGADVNQSRTYHLDAVTRAARAGHADVIRELVKAGFSLKGGLGLDALEGAIQKNQQAAALAIIEGNIRVRGMDAGNVLVAAVKKGWTEVVRALLKIGVDPKARTEDDQVAIQVAEAMGHRKIAAMLQAARSPQASPGQELIEAAERGVLKVVHRLILEGVDLESRDAKGATALIRASANCHLPVMQRLLAAGANPNACTPFVKRDKKVMFHHMDLTSETPLSCAVAAHSLPAVELLLEAGADVRRTECGHLVCMILQEGSKDNLPLVERLLDAGMDPESRWPVLNVSALEIAAQEGFMGLVEKLISAGARLKTPLERDRAIVDAIQDKRLQVAVMLIEHGIAPEVKGVITSKALVCAAIEGLDAIVRLLLERGVKIDRRVDASFESQGWVEGITALMAAARHGRVSTLEILLSAGADPKVEDPIGRTALDWAHDNKNQKSVQKICRLLENATTTRRRRT